MRSRTTIKLSTSSGGTRDNGSTDLLCPPSFNSPVRVGMAYRDRKFRSVWPLRDRRRTGNQPGLGADGTAEIRDFREIVR